MSLFRNEKEKVKQFAKEVWDKAMTPAMPKVPVPYKSWIEYAIISRNYMTLDQMLAASLELKLLEDDKALLDSGMIQLMGGIHKEVPLRNAIGTAIARENRRSHAEKERGVNRDFEKMLQCDREAQKVKRDRTSLYSIRRCPSCKAMALDLMHISGLQYYKCGHCKKEF